MSVLRAARTLGRVSEWTLSNLSIQKILYIAQGIHLAKTTQPLFSEAFEAWDYGPVVPSLYRTLKKFGSSPVGDIFSVPIFALGTDKHDAISEAWGIAKAKSPGQLVTYTHRLGGAWEMYYDPELRGVVIPVHCIARETDPSARASDEAAAWALEMAANFETSPAKFLDHQNERNFRARLRDDAGKQSASRH